MKAEIYNKINEIVIAGLEKKGMEWFKPWRNSNGLVDGAYNYTTKRSYSGFNIFLLNAVMADQGYEFNQWLTFKQVSALKGKVIKGQKATDVYFWNQNFFDALKNTYVSSKDKKTINRNEKLKSGSLRYSEFWTLTFHKVFNVSQCEGIEPHKELDIAYVEENEPIEVAESLVQDFVKRENNFKIIHRENRAYYNKKTDFINMPDMNLFIGSEEYYKTLFHEIVHSTGHKSRLNRKTLEEVSSFGSVDYSKEELVAEIGSMYITGLLGLDPKDTMQNSQAYIKGWCKHLREAKDECIYAMQQATKAVKYIREGKAVNIN